MKESSSYFSLLAFKNVFLSSTKKLFSGSLTFFLLCVNEFHLLDTVDLTMVLSPKFVFEFSPTNLIFAVLEIEPANLSAHPQFKL